MDTILDETSLVPCTSWPPPRRIQLLASVLRALDRLGAPRVLRSVRDAAARDIGLGRGLRSWCTDRATDRDAGLLVASRLSRQPFIDGDDGLFAALEGARAIEATVNGQVVFGLALAAMNDEIAVALGRASRPHGGRVAVTITCLGDDGETAQTLDAVCAISPDEVETERASIEMTLDRGVADGAVLLARAEELFPCLRFGPRSAAQIRELTGAEPVFRQLIRHLRALELGARDWRDGPFSPGKSISWSDESNSTLDHGRYGPMRDFPPPEGFAALRWRFHTKLTAGAGYRLYFHGERTSTGPVVLVGYFGPHLPTVKYRT